MTKDRTSSVARADSDGASTMDLSGRCVGSSYILQYPIGQGATGTVWRGLDRASGEPVAVKLLHESLLRQPKLVTRFVQERTILLMLRHRNVVRVRDLFSVGQTLGLVMDLVEGGSLREHVREHGPMPAGEAARLACQVAAALAEAHELGVIHRDLKPDNILLRHEDGRLDTRLTDFGVARILNTPSMTTGNAVMGTPHYMAPEAFHGTTASPATDVYALGVLLYELVTGRPPYDSDQIPELMRMHMEGNPKRPPGLAEPVWEVIDMCMATKPRLRPSAAELVVSLSDAARDCAGTAALAPRLRAPAPAPVESMDEPDPVSLVPLPVSLPLPVPVPVPGPRQPVAVSEAPRPASPPRKDRGNASPSWRWARPGATLIAGAMLASAVAATAWHFERADRETAMTPVPQVLVESSAPRVQPGAQAEAQPGAQQRGTTGARVQRKAVAAHETGRAPGPASHGTAAARSATVAPVPPENPAETRSPQPEARPYGPWQCTERLALDAGTRTPLLTRPCQMLGRDVQFQASLIAPGGATGSITVSLQDENGKTVAGPTTCDGLTFGGDAATQACGPEQASPARGRRYAVVMTFRYERRGRIMAGATRGSVFAW